MIDVNTIKLPTHFSHMESEGESRFIPVKIFIAHTGENLNNSVFSKEVLDSMIPTLTNIPILGYVATKEDGEKDFRGHEKNISIDGTSVNINYKTHAYGFIPENNNAHFEVTGGKEWLVAEGYLWSRFVDAVKLFDESGGTKGQSMEVSHADGYTDQYGRIVYTTAQFEGLCILGDDVPPAMTGSVISTEFSKADFKTAFQEMLAEFSAEKGENALATKKTKDEEATVSEVVKPGSDAKKSDSKTSDASKSVQNPAKEDEKKAEKPVPAPAANTESKENEKAPSDDKGTKSASEEPVSDEHSDDHAEMAEDPKKKEKTASMAKDDKASQDKEENKDEDADDVDDDSDENKDKKTEMACGDGKKKKEFELSLDDQEYAFTNAVREKYGSSYDYIYPTDIYEDYGIVKAVQDDGKSQYFCIGYSVNADDSIQLGDKTEVFPAYLTAEEKAEVEANRTKVADLESQLEELKAYKNGVEMSKKEQILKDNEKELSDEQTKKIKAQFTQLTPEEVEKEVAFAIFEAHKAEKKNNSGFGMRAVNFSVEKKGLGYGSADALFHK